MGKRKGGQIKSLFCNSKKSPLGAKKIKKHKSYRAQMKQLAAQAKSRGGFNQKLATKARVTSTIVISDSEEEQEDRSNEMNATVMPNPAAALTPPPDKGSGEAPLLFYESRSPNNGKDSKPVYNMGPTQLCLGGMGDNTSFSSQNDSILNRPASTPVDVQPRNPFEYSMISDTSLQLTTTITEDQHHTIAAMNEENEDFLNLEETVVRVAKEEKLPESSSTVVANNNQTLEDGEIIDVEVENNGADDSVVFVSEEVLTPTRKQKLSRKLNMVQLLREKAETLRKQNHQPQNKTKANSPKLQPRMIIIDGSNVAFSHTENGRFSVRGLELCLDHFLSRGFQVKAVVPQFRMKRTQTDNHVKMMELEQKKLLIKTPAKDLAGTFAASYDDRFILNIAKEFDAAVVSNDNYRDLLSESEDFSFIIRNRVIGYTWVMDKLFIPEDPYGKIGPNLNQILFVAGNNNQ